MSQYLLGLDLGTSAVKALLLTEAGAVAGSATAPLPLGSPRPGWSEQEPDEWVQAARQAIKSLLQHRGIDPAQVAALAASGQMHGATLLDAAGRPVRPCILWNDQRSSEECASIEAALGREGLLAEVSNPALAGFTAPKLLWVRRHEPEVWARAAAVLLPKDYLNYWLTGQLATEVSDASGTLLFDVNRRRWSEPVLQALELDPGLLPPVHASTAVIGHLTAEASAATGLRAGMPVVAGGADNACAAVGLGVVRPGQVMVSIGTSGTVLAPAAQPATDPQGRLHTFCHAVPGLWYLMGVVLSAGGSLRWFLDTLAADLSHQARREGRDAYDLVLAMAAQAPPGSEGLIFLPYLSGERTPHPDPAARGVFFGLSLRHDRSHLARSVLEGVSFALADAAQLMRALGLDLTRVRVTGGGARSELWRQMLADTLEATVLTTRAEEGPALGAAMLAGVGVGMFPSIPAAVERVVQLRAEVPPGVNVPLYRRYHALYDQLYPALRENFAVLAALREGGSDAHPNSG